MASTRKRQFDRTALDLVEEAARLLRRAPGGVLLGYYIGSVPCMLGLLYFFADVTHGAFARTHLIGASFIAALLYLWMKCWHTVFNRGLADLLSRETPEPWTPARIARMIFLQAAVQPSGLFVRLLAFIMLLPYVWVYGFYQGFGIFGDGKNPSLSDCARRAWTQAKWRPGQAHGALGYLKIFAFFVWLNVLVFIFFAPQLLRIFTGIETPFTLTPMAMFNTTVFAASFAITYLCFDPLRKALYVLRCFYGDALRTGQDLEVELRALKSPARIAAVAALMLILSPIGPHTIAAEPSVAAERVDSAKLSESIEEVLNRREYTWRLPREAEGVQEKSFFVRFIEESIESIGKTLKKIQTWWRKILQRKSSSDRDGGEGGFSWANRGMLYTAIALSIGLIAFYLWKQRRNLRIAMVAAQPLAAVPDLRADDVFADQLPEDGWLKLARELMDQGEFRLALRASYLAGLAHLGQRQLITIARHKSNLDYESELRRRARSREELLTAFDANLDAFERAWYGLHEVTRDTLGRFNANLDRIRAC